MEVDTGIGMSKITSFPIHEAKSPIKIGPIFFKAAEDRKKRWREKWEERNSKTPRFMLEENPLKPEYGWTVENERSCIVASKDRRDEKDVGDDHLNKSAQEMSKCTPDKERSPMGAVKELTPFPKHEANATNKSKTRRIFFEMTEEIEVTDEYIDKMMEDMLVQSFSRFAMMDKTKEEMSATREKARDILHFLAKKLTSFIELGNNSVKSDALKEMKTNLNKQPAYVGRVRYILESEYKSDEDKNVLFEVLFDAVGIDLTLGSEKDRQRAINDYFHNNISNDDVHLVCDKVVMLSGVCHSDVV